MKRVLIGAGVCLLGGLLAHAQKEVALPPQVKVDPQIKIDPKIVGILSKVPRVKGFADLHCHPAAHLAFGAADAGSGKLIAGLPGMTLGATALADDLKDCAAEHFWDDSDIVRSSTRTQIRNGLDAGMPHGRGGWPELRSWPNARSVTHQQMHISWVYRAYLGGLRLMVASLSDNQTLAMLWNRKQSDSRPAFNPNSDFEVAKREAAFIESWVRANGSWAQIVTTPAQARDVIGRGKLAVILSTEMDTLTTEQILILARDHKVRMVMPIHFANNQFGGPAAYGDMFNTNNHYLTGSFYSVLSDPSLAFQLGDATYLRYMDHTEVDDAGSFFAGLLTMGTIGIGAMKPTVEPGIVYPTAGGGHRNNKAFNEESIRPLLKAGLIIDTAHMSQLGHEGILRVTKTPDYPVLNSHTGFRNGPAESERAMRESDARIMASRGGVVGIGTVGDNQTATVLDAVPARGASNVVRLTNTGREWLTRRRPITDAGYNYRFVRVTLTTGKDDKRDQEAAFAVIKTEGTRQEFNLVPERRGLGGGTMMTKTFPLTTPLSLRDITFVGVRHDTGSYFHDGQHRDPDNWDVKSVKIELLPDPVTAWAQDAASMLNVMGARGIALGTDFNGLEKQMPGLPTIAITYPVTIVSRFAPEMRLSDGSVPPELRKQNVVGSSRIFDFRDDGLAHFGMLPDFLQAVSQTPAGEKVVRNLFDGAEEVIRLWEKVEVAKARVP